MNVIVSPEDLKIAADTAALASSQPSLEPGELRLMDAYWRAANYLSVGQIYLYENPMLREPLKLSHVKPLVVGHWGTTPGQNFIYVHLNRAIKRHDLDMIYVAGPGHGGPALVANTYLEGSYSEIYPDISQDEAGMKRLFKQFSFPAAYRAMSRPRRPARSMRAANSVIRSATPSAPPSTIPACSSPASSVTARPRRDRSRPLGSPTSFSIRSPMAPCCRSCISTATRSAIQQFSPAYRTTNWRNFSRAVVGPAIRRGRRARGHASPDGRNRGRRDRSDSSHPEARERG